MIEEEAYVAEVAEGWVWLEKTRRSACSSCAQTCPTSLAGGLFGEKTVRLKVASDLPLRCGDRVMVGLNEDALALGSIRVYLLPLFGLFAGALAAKSFGGSDGVSALGGLLGLMAIFAGLKFYRPSERPGQQPVILRKID